MTVSCHGRCGGRSSSQSNDSSITTSGSPRRRPRRRARGRVVAAGDVRQRVSSSQRIGPSIDFAYGSIRSFCRVEAVALLRLPGAVDAVAVALARPGPGQIAVPVEGRPLGQLVARLAVGLVEEDRARPSPRARRRGRSSSPRRPRGDRAERVSRARPSRARPQERERAHASSSTVSLRSRPGGLRGRGGARASAPPRRRLPRARAGARAAGGAGGRRAPPARGA